MKPFFTLIFLIAAVSGMAQKRDTSLLKNSNFIVSSIDSADFIRIVTQPDLAQKAYWLQIFIKAVNAS